MTLYLIGIGLNDEKDITVKGLEIIKSCDKIYLEDYTSILQVEIKKLEELYKKKIILADRNFVEKYTEEIVKEAKTKEITFLVIGDPFSATTHIELFKQAKEKNTEVKIINNASILTAVGITGLELYKFGKTTSIPFYREEIETPYNILKENSKTGLHTLFLLDLNPSEKKFMTVKEALEILEKIENKKKQKLINKEILVVGCARLGSDDYKIKAGPLEKIKQANFGGPPHCLIIPGKLHFIEEEMLNLWRYSKVHK